MRRVPSAPARCRSAGPRFLSEFRSRDAARMSEGADMNTGQQLSFMAPPDISPHFKFMQSTLEHVKVPEVEPQRRAESDLERARRVREKFASQKGPGEVPEKSVPAIKRDMLQQQQDIDGLPWELRWRRLLIPSPEEAVQEIRDRYDLFVADPIEREKLWYLHWKDRFYRVQRDRLVWPQGFTDYFDHYDESGRRRVLPGDQKWSDSSWKHLADAQYRDRMWLVEGEERRALRASLADTETVVNDADKHLQDHADCLMGMTYGTVDLSYDQVYEAAAGTAKPYELAKAKHKIHSYAAVAHQKMLSGELEEKDIDPNTGLPKSNEEPLPSGLTVEEATLTVGMGRSRYEALNQVADRAHMQGKDGLTAVAMESVTQSRTHGGVPHLTAEVQARVDAIQSMKQREARSLASAQQRIEGVTQEEKQADVPAIAAAASIIDSEQATLKEGYVEIPQRPLAAEPNVREDMYYVPHTIEHGDMPKWYIDEVVDTGAMIQSYGLTGDPIETMERPQSYRKRQETHRARNDRITQGDSAFDYSKMRVERNMPELADGVYKPLPLYRDAAKTSDASEKKVALTVAPPKMHMANDPDLLLPSLPWETDAVIDPYRGVSTEDAVPFDKAAAEKTWMTYRGFMYQTLSEHFSMGKSANVTKADLERHLRDAIARIRRDAVGEHPPINSEQLFCIQLIYESHVLYLMCNELRMDEKPAEADALQRDIEALQRQAIAKGKLLGPSFSNFLSEMNLLELEQIKKNPLNRNVVQLRDERLRPVARPFVEFAQTSLQNYQKHMYPNMEAAELAREVLMKELNNIVSRAPLRIPDVPENLREAVVNGMHAWCAGSVYYAAGEQLMRMYLKLGDTQLRQAAQGLFDNSNDYFHHYWKVSNRVVTVPIPGSNPPYEYTDSDFVDGQNAVVHEMCGNLEKADALWHSGSLYRWYPVFDETEYMMYNERRGIISLAIEISDRCLENLNRRTHPSIHPFPERAQKYLEGAPLTQETAEHLWMRYMGDVYREHAEFNRRIGRFATAEDHRRRALNFYHIAMRTAEERLPKTWKAVLLTRAKYLCSAFCEEEDPCAFSDAVVKVVDDMYALGDSLPSYWVDRRTGFHYRLAVVFENLVAFAGMVGRRTMQKHHLQITQEQLIAEVGRRARGEAEYSSPEVERYLSHSDEFFETHFRTHIRRWMSKEKAGSDAHTLWVHMYFQFRLHAKSDADVDEWWAMYEPAYESIMVNTCIGQRTHGERLFPGALRRCCNILHRGNRIHLEKLLKVLKHAAEKMSHYVIDHEIARTIANVERRIAEPGVPPYSYLQSSYHRELTDTEENIANPVLRVSLGSQSYEVVKKQQEQMRNQNMMDSPTPRQVQAKTDDDGPVDRRPVSIGRDYFDSLAKQEK